MPTEVLGRRALNRALLARQLLLRRDAMPVADAVEHLLGLQAQDPLPPYQALWSRLDAFDPHALGRMLVEREAVRLTLMRATVHLVTARDAWALRPLMQPAIERGHQGAFGKRMAGATPEAIAAATREELAADGPLGARELGRRLVARGIGDDAEAIGNATRVHAPLVQVPPRGVWGESGQARYATLEDWVGGPLDAVPVESIVVRYLAAFGPATVKDMQWWSGLTKLAGAFAALREREEVLVVRDEDGRELFDVPGAPRPDPDAPAPPRLLGVYDNALLSHADRTRIIPEGRKWGAAAEGRLAGNLLVDGMLAGWWWVDRDGTRRATLTLRPFAPLSRPDRDAVAAEAEGMLAFMAADAASREVTVAPE